MNTLLKYSAITLLTLLFFGCSGSGGGGEQPTLGTEPKMTGVWGGDINGTSTVSVIAENGSSFVTDIDGTVLWMGNATTQGSNISISTKRYTNDANNGTDDVLTATASSDTLTLTTPAGSGPLTYSNLYEDDSTLSQTAGIWTIATTDLGAWTITANADGTFRGQFGNGCMANGTLSIIDSRYNPMALAITLTICPSFSLNGNYTGLATLTSEAPGTKNSLSFAFANGSDEGAYFDDIRKQ